MNPLQKIGNVPFDLSVLQSLYPECGHITDKAIRLEAEGAIIRLKRGLYVVNPESGALSRGLIANHMYGPSYVSRHTALRHYGLTPEAVYLTQSVTTKHSRQFSSSAGCYDYRNCAPEYFHIGVRAVSEGGVSYLIASPEKALCDAVNFGKGVNLRFMKDVAAYLEEDIRFDMSALSGFDAEMMARCVPFSSKGQSISSLVKFIRYEYAV